MPSFLLDESVPVRLAQFLRKKGLDTLTLQDLGLAGIRVSNGALARIALEERKIIITADTGFLDLLTSQPELQIVLIRMTPRTERNVTELFEKYLEMALMKLGEGVSIIISAEGVLEIPRRLP